MNIFLLFVLVLPAVLFHLFTSLAGKLFPPAKDGVGSKDNAGTEESDGKTERNIGCVSKPVLVDEPVESEERAHEEILSEVGGSSDGVNHEKSEAGGSCDGVNHEKTVLSEAGGSSDISGDHHNSQNTDGVNHEKTVLSEAGGSCDGVNHEKTVLSETGGSSDISGDHDNSQNTDGVNHEKTEVYLEKEDEESEVLQNDIVKEESVDEEDDWEGIESSQLEKLFWDAVVYVASKDNGDEIHGLASDLKLQLYGLNKVAMEGPCNVPQPMALKVSARAKWNAWLQLGNMSPEEAMEKYIDLLTSSIPGWTEVPTARASR